ncbi:MAG: HAMP domain-containing protein [Magnetococcales bacterium]|nr:HAMP domain-containing protein [Magnetococcales bacterium]
MGIMIVCFSVIGSVSVSQYLGLDAARTAEEHHDEVVFLTNQVVYKIFDLHMSITHIETAEDLAKLFPRLDNIDNSILILKKKGGNSKTVIALNEMKNRLGTLVVELFELRKQLGLNEDLGEQGGMRSVIHKIENDLTDAGLVDLLVEVLQIRRREKDVFLRGHKQSREKLQYAMDQFQIKLAKNTEISDELRSKTSLNISKYYEVFLKTQTINSKIQKKTNEILLVTNKLLKYSSRLMREQQRRMLINKQDQRTLLNNISISIFIALVMTFLVLGVLVYLLLQSIITPVNVLNEKAKEIASGNFDAKIVLYGTDEIGELARSLENMKDNMLDHQRELEDTVAKRTQHLDVTNSVLRDIIADLNQTQEELVQSEKMASLGRLVAGFAHEINTPIGVAVSTISHIPDMTNKLNEMLSGDEVDGDELDRLLENLGKASSLGMSNLNKAADLVRRFKRTSMDQTSEDIRDFNLYELLKDSLVTLHNVFKNTKIELDLQCSNKLKICSQPGIIGQVMTNLLMNSYKHGFNSGKLAGKITIEASFDGEAGVNIKYSDNGCGISPENLSHIFEPFVTTARSQGGSGLGLYISYNIITTQLNGEITCYSELGHGVVFDINIPNVMLVEKISSAKNEFAGKEK